jgi:alanyl-tRNA synthetase
MFFIYFAFVFSFIFVQITDGAQPGNDGRNYVLKRIIRRACRYGREFLGGKDIWFYKLTDAVISLMGDFFPEIKNRAQHVKGLFCLLFWLFVCL